MTLRSILCDVTCVAALALSSTASAQYVLFDAPTDTISVPGQTVVGQSFTIEARFQMDEVTEGSRIYSEQRHAEEDKWLAAHPLGASAGAWTSTGYVLGTWPVYAGNVCPGRWHHLAYVRDGSEQRLYFDGVLVDTVLWSEPIANSPLSTRAIGGFPHSGGFGAGMEGLLDYVRVSSSARYDVASFTPPMESDFVIDPDTLLFYRFDETPGSTVVVDSSDYGYHGTIGVGFPDATSPTFTESAPESAPADLDGDGTVGSADLAILLSVWGESGCTGDLNGDGIVNASDLSILLAAWGT